MAFLVTFDLSVYHILCMSCCMPFVYYHIMSSVHDVFSTPTDVHAQTLDLKSSAKESLDLLYDIPYLTFSTFWAVEFYFPISHIRSGLPKQLAWA